MQVLSSKIDLDDFFARVRELPRKILLLDYDGTLAPFQEDPQKAYPYEGVEDALNAIIATGQARIVLISGRRAEDLTRLLSLKQMPEIWGSHGFERRMPDGRILPGQLIPKQSEGLKLAEEWAQKTQLPARLERKPAGLAFHWRGLDDETARTIRSQINSEWEKRALDYNLKLLPFDCGLELKPAEIDKGHAVQQIFADLHQPAAVAYLGDDLTDEDAFEALGELGLAVLVRKEVRKTSADLWLKPPAELLDFLARFNSACQIV